MCYSSWVIFNLKKKFLSFIGELDNFWALYLLFKFSNILKLLILSTYRKVTSRSTSLLKSGQNKKSQKTF